MSQYSEDTERYVTSVIAVGGEWPARVTNLRNTFPGNENAFKAALEKYVYAAHGQPAPPISTTTSSAGQDNASVSSSSVTQRSYPGQMQQQAVPLPLPPPPIPIPIPMHSPAHHATATSASASTLQSQNSSTYIPYAREQRVPSGRRQGLAGSGQTNYPSTSAVLNRSQPRTSSSLNPAAVRPNKLPHAYPVTYSRQSLPPFFPISTGHAYMTTYPSRLRLGLTNLIQPVTANGTVVAATAAPTAVAASKNKEVDTQARSNVEAASILGKRQRSQVDYRERVDIPEPPSSSSDDEIGGEGPIDGTNETEEDSKLSRAARAAKRSGIPVPATTSATRDSPAPQTANAGDTELSRTREKDVGGGGRSWLGQDPPGDLVFVQPARRHLLPYVSETDLTARAKDRPLLVPIRIELDTDAYRIRDSFTWNLAESFITPELFCKVFCLDADISYEPYGVQMAASIRSQLDEYVGVAEVSLLTPEQEVQEQEADLRVIINIDVQIGTLHLVDRVEWDLTSSLSPESFATSLCSDLGLGGEAIMLISHAVHEELLRLKRDCLEMGLVGKTSNEGGRSQGPKRLESVWRDWNESKSFGPHVEILSPENIDALEMEKERNPRRLRRSDARWGAVAVQRERPGRRR